MLFVPPGLSITQERGLCGCGARYHLPHCADLHSPARGGARRGERGGAAATWAAALLTHHKRFCVLDTRTSVPHFAYTVQILGQFFSEVGFMGCWWGSPRRSRALDSGPTITGGRSRSPSDSRRGLVPVAPPAPRPRREGRACAPQSSDIICSPPAALAADDTPRRGSRARSLHGPRHSSPFAASPL